MRLDAPDEYELRLDALDEYELRLTEREARPDDQVERERLNKLVDRDEPEMKMKMLLDE